MDKREDKGAVPKRRVSSGYRMDKEKKQVKALVEGAFKHFGKDEIYEGQFIKYFKNKGLSKEEADQLGINAHAKRIIEIEIRPVISKGKTLKILGYVTVFIMADKKN